MKIQDLIRKSLLTGLIAATGLPVAQAAPGNLADQPLFTGTKVKPNIMFVMDDSGSMDWEVLLTDGARDEGYSHNSGNLDFTPDNSTERLELCVGYNALAYDPKKTYTPWKGVDQAGNPFGDQSYTAARKHPYYTSTANLKNHYYFAWRDNGDGVFQKGECPTKKKHRKYVKDLSASEKTNYANWYTYYRKREYVAKRSLTELISTNTETRMGLKTLHNNNSVWTSVKDNDDDGNRAALLKNAARINSSGGTPLRTALKSTGEYFRGKHSPILPLDKGGACQQNFAVVMSDGYWNGSSPYVGNVDGDSSNKFAGGSYADKYSNTLADVAMYYYSTDLAPSLPPAVPTIDGVDENPEQHLVTFTVAFGVPGTLDANPTNPKASFNWPKPTNNQPTTTDDMRHAAWNGRGKFLNAGDPQELIDSLSDAIATIIDRTGAGGTVAFSNTQLETDTVVYQGLFNSNGWSGDLRAYSLDANTQSFKTTPDWSAADKLDARNLKTQPRTILTHNGSTGVAFEWDQLSTAQKNDLRHDGSGVISGQDDVAKARLAFIRGDTSHEGTGHNFRDRKSRLGDIISSSPVYVGDPMEYYWLDSAPFPTGAQAYSTFVTNTSRDGIIYVGGNDGMLHAFNESGEEVLAYIPGTNYSTAKGRGLHFLTQPDYAHRYHVDLTPTTAPAHIKTSAAVGATAAWRTVLLGGQRAGGRGLFALDITDPSQFKEAKAADLVLWEFTNANDADLGYTYSKPTVVLLNNGRWAAIFGNGYNDTGSGEAQLFIVYLEGGIDGTWSYHPSDWTATDYIKLSTGVGSAADRNGLSTPEVVDVNGDGTADRVYAGDLHGNLWVFDLCNEDADGDCQASGWDVAYQDGGNPQPLFTGLATQPITAKPTVIRHPDSAVGSDENAGDPNLVVLFGTGQYLTEADKTNTDTQAFYGVWDRGVGGLTKSKLQQQTITNVDGNKGRTATSHSVDWMPADEDDRQYGYYANLPDSGERADTDPVVRGDIVYFNTKIPSADACQAGGSGWEMSLSISNGGAPPRPVFDYNRDGVIDSLDTYGRDKDAYVGSKTAEGLPGGAAFSGNKQVTVSTDTHRLRERLVESLGGSNAGRMSWQEL
ncbi:pilus assembly protein [Alkalilimnicola sp. S0819]|uniref:pilus assembly protein n=1 Tax=Alkalilimnicola sp. S0819 TaxID=2613922 RepID=UPI0012618BE3|nr:PilC/PilY family type IV pilus protein [Alkalilimnicola sp. S0819]KAB7623152.1 hypothetical protein F3N43_10155 [Alkalilimnicola sp. S0819]MPQ16996.1 hypothetical protein [Alkalilimnicola sp. S0819]